MTHRDSPEHWLQLARTQNVGPVTFHNLIDRFKTAKQAIDAIPDLARRGGRMAKLNIPSIADVKAERKAGKKYGAQLVLSCDNQYPELLRETHSPPPVLWCIGNISLLSKPSVAIVGSRNASAAGLKMAQDISVGLGQQQYIVTSGMARGVDAAAHTSSLQTGTIAVLGGGIDHIYPQENAQLHAQIAKQGCIISESPMGYTAQARDFPRRNRIIAGLSQGIVVIEAAQKSGTLITASLAADMGREVMAVPGSPLDPRAKGTNTLIRDGATLIEGADDVIAALTHMSRQIKERDNNSEYTAPKLSPEILDQQVDAIRDQLLSQLTTVPVHRDHLIRLHQNPPAVINAALAELELAGHIDVLPGGQIVKRVEA